MKRLMENVLKRKKENKMPGYGRASGGKVENRGATKGAASTKLSTIKCPRGQKWNQQTNECEIDHSATN